MASASSFDFCDLPQATFTFNLGSDILQMYPALDLALRAISQILINDHLILNFAAHFIPYEEYDGRLPCPVPESTMKLMKETFTPINLPSILLLDSSTLQTKIHRTAYGCYRGRENENERNIIYLNREILECSKYNAHPDDFVKCACVALFTIIHELGHLLFHHFSCNFDDDLSAPKGVLMEEAGEAIEFHIFGFNLQHYGTSEPKFIIDEIVTKFNNGFKIIPINYMKSIFKYETYQHIRKSTSLSIKITDLKAARTMSEQLAKHNYKIFDPHDEPKRDDQFHHIKRIFYSYDKKK